MRSLTFPILLTLWICSCSNPENTKEMTTDQPKKEVQEEPTRTEVKKTLSQELDERIAKSNAKPKSEKSVAYANGIQSVRESGVTESALQVGGKAPDFKLNNALGKSVSLYDELKKGPVVLIWYRGGWCPYCNLTLHYMQEALPSFQAEGATLLALSPELPDKSMDTAEKHALEFEVLSDVGNVVAHSYGVVFKLNEDVADYYEESFGLEDYNGDKSNELPLAATYVIDTQGMVHYAFLDADYRKRAEPGDILEALKGL